MAGHISDGTTCLSNVSLTGKLVTSTLTAIGPSSLGSLNVTGTISSTGAASLGTLSVTGTVAVTGASAYSGALTIGASGYTGTPLYAASATSFLGVAMVVNGSASSFSVFVWPAVRRGDFIDIVPVGGAVSSMSSGLVLHSHCTQDGQCEVRWSNVSTLVQNQSAVSYFIGRRSMF